MSQVSQLSSEIESVVIYRRGATVTRLGKLFESSETLCISDLPIDLDDNSVEVELAGAPESVKAHQVAVKVGLPADTAVDSLGEEIKKAKQELATREAEYQAQSQLVKALYDFSPLSRPKGVPGEPPPPQQLDGHLALLEFREEQLDQMLVELGRLKEDKRKAAESLSELEARAAESAPKTRPEELRKLVEISLSEPAEVGEVRISYRVQGARWAPAYSLRLKADMSSSEFSMRALVAQSTGEDWADVKVSVSTADPLNWRECPELKSQRIGRAQARPASSWRPPPLGTASLFQDYDSFTKLPTKPASIARPKPQSVEVLMKKDEFEDEDCFELDEDADFLGAADYEVESEPMLCMSAIAPEPASAPVASAPAGGGGMVVGRSRGMQKKAKISKDKSATGRLEQESYEEVVTLDNRLSQYGRLRMMSVAHPRRGELVWQNSISIYAETSISTSLILTAVQQQEWRAAQLHGLALPSGHLAPGAMEGFDYLYESRGLVRVPADGQFHSIPMQSEEFEPKVNFIAVPRESLDVFRTVYLENNTDFGFCQGPVDVFVDEDYLHTTPLGNVGPNESFELGLGVTEEVKVKRQTHFKEGTSGLMGGTTSLPHKVEYEVVNASAASINLELRERLPEVDESYKKEIKIEVDKVEPEWERYKQKDTPELKSSYRWLLPIPAGDTLKAKVSYTISMASKYELVGGNRREALS